MFRVLVVDDEQSIRATLGQFLADAGFDVDVAQDVDEAQRKLGDGAVDVVLSDIVLPRATGMTLMHFIRRAAPRVQVILMTGEPTVETAAEAVRAGAFDYLCKPVCKEAVVRSVSRAARLKALDDERERLAQVNRQYQEGLESLVEERTRALQVALDAVKRTQQETIKQERLNALGQMVSGIAHDFNNALMPILGLADFLVQHPHVLDDRGSTLGMLQDIRGAARDARDIVRRLREFYRPGERLDTAPVDIAALCRRALQLTEPAWKVQAEARGGAIQVVEDMGPDLPVCVGNEASLREALANLILNAADAMPKGGTLRVSARTAGAAVVLEVADTGAGMSEETRRRCLEPFFTTKGEHGTGLGLSMCYGIVQRHGGNLEIDSEPGRGTVVRIRLPLAPQAPAESPAASPFPPPPSPSLQGRRVLAVDDEAGSRALLSKYLACAGMAVETAASGEEALTLLDRQAFDLVLTDRAMPGLSGDQLAHDVKQRAPGCRVIMLTGFGDMMQFKRDRPEGVDAILGKPVQQDEVLNAIRGVLGVTP